jgi:hypothetical protein
MNKSGGGGAFQMCFTKISSAVFADLRMKFRRCFCFHAGRSCLKVGRFPKLFKVRESCRMKIAAVL